MASSVADVALRQQKIVQKDQAFSSATTHTNPYLLEHDEEVDSQQERDDDVSRPILSAIRRFQENLGFHDQIRTKNKESSAYTICDFEPMVYNDNHHHRSSGLLMEDQIIGVREDSNHSITPGVLRCFKDWRVKLADAVMIISVVLTGILTPLTFIWGGPWGGTPVLVLDVLLDLVYAAHLLLQLNVSFLHPKLRLEICERGKILRRRLQCPIYWAKWLSVTCYFWIGIANGPLLLNNIKVVRIGSLTFLPDSLWRLRDRSILLVGRPTFLLALSSHWVACLLACIGGYRETMDSQGESYFRLTSRDITAPDRVAAYLMAFVEAIYMLTGAMDNPLGDGGARAHNFGNLLLVTMLGPIGIVTISLVISNVVRTSSLANALEIRHEHNKAFIMRALENLDIPQDLQRRVCSLHHFQRWSHDYEAFDELFKRKNLSAPLETALRIYLYHECFLYSGYFKGKDTNYILEVVRVLEDRIFVPGDYVVRRGEVGFEMFFVARGSLSVRIPHRKAELRHDLSQAFVGATLQKGSYFGEIALVANCLRTAWVCAETYVILSELRRQAIEGIWKYFPTEREILIKTITSNTRRNRQEAMQRLWHHVAKRGVEEVRRAQYADGGGSQQVWESTSPRQGRGVSPATETASIDMVLTVPPLQPSPRHARGVSPATETASMDMMLTVPPPQPEMAPRSPPTTPNSKTQTESVSIWKAMGLQKKPSEEGNVAVPEGQRTLVDEMEARFRYAQEASDLLEGMRAKPMLPVSLLKSTNSTEDEGDGDHTLELGHIMRHFERCCNHLLQSQGETTGKMEALSKTIDALSDHQAVISRAAFELLSDISDAKAQPKTTDANHEPEDERRNSILFKALARAADAKHELEEERRSSLLCKVLPKTTDGNHAPDDEQRNSTRSLLRVKITYTDDSDEIDSHMVPVIEGDCSEVGIPSPRRTVAPPVKVATRTLSSLLEPSSEPLEESLSGAAPSPELVSPRTRQARMQRLRKNSPRSPRPVNTIRTSNRTDSSAYGDACPEGTCPQKMKRKLRTTGATIGKPAKEQSLDLEERDGVAELKDSASLTAKTSLSPIAVSVADTE